MYILSEELKSLYPAFLSTTSFAQDAFSECVFKFFFSPVMLQAGYGSGLRSVGRIRIRSKMDRIRNTAGYFIIHSGWDRHRSGISTAVSTVLFYYIPEYQYNWSYFLFFYFTLSCLVPVSVIFVKNIHHYLTKLHTDTGITLPYR